MPNTADQPIDFFARRIHYVDHLAPVWGALGERRGMFFVPEGILDHAQKLGIKATTLKPIDPAMPLNVAPKSGNPLVVCAYGDLAQAYNVRPQRTFIFLEHGVGITPSGHAGYAGGTGLRRKVALFLAPNEYIRAKTAQALPGAHQVVVGTPKLDEFAPALSPAYRFVMGKTKPVICISFHWNGEKISPEAGNAFKHYQDVVGLLAQGPWKDEFTLIGHGHPREIERLAVFYESVGIEVERNFRNVMRIADVYVNDCSSTAYEFCVTGKPVILLNAPWFRRDVNWGIRFWDYSNIGRQVDEPEQLFTAILQAINNPDHYVLNRYDMVQELYPFLGYSAQRAAGAILGFCGGKK